MIDASALTGWLVETGGPVVRWRAASELGGGAPPPGRDLLVAALLQSDPVREWLPRLSLAGFPSSLAGFPSSLAGFPSSLAGFPAALEALDPDSLRKLGGLVHGSKAACLENVLGKLAEFGLRAGMPGLDEQALPLMAIFRWKPDWQSEAVFQNAWERLVKTVFAWGLLRLGYAPDAAMADFIKEHLRLCWKIAHDRVFDLYAAESELRGLPKAWAGKPILKQEVMANYWLPYIHDLYLFANLPVGFLDENENGMLGEWAEYLLDPRFQALRDGYGYAWIKERRTCYGWGWSPHLPGFQDFTALAGGSATPFLSRLELMARLPAGRRSGWLRDALHTLEGYREPSGKFRFPPGFLREAEGYYVSGFHMGLGENRRAPGWVEIESTFRMLAIKRLIEMKPTEKARYP